MAPLPADRGVWLAISYQPSAFGLQPAAPHGPLRLTSRVFNQLWARLTLFVADSRSLTTDSYAGKQGIILADTVVSKSQFRSLGRQECVDEDL